MWSFPPPEPQSLPDALQLMKDTQENWHSPSHRLPDKTSCKTLPDFSEWLELLARAWRGFWGADPCVTAELWPPETISVTDSAGSLNPDNFTALRSLCLIISVWGACPFPGR